MKNKTIFPNKLNKPLIITGILSFVVLSGLIALLVFLNQKNQEKVQAKMPIIALVNEDQSSKFNNQDYNFGKNFVDLASNDNKYSWQVVSRSVADKAYIDGSVDAVIYLPQTFSHDLLTLQDIDPTKAEVAYKIKSQSDALSENLLQDKITSVLYEFNQNVVKMYYASVAGNIAEAENQMNQVVVKQENLVTNLSNQVHSPFKSSMPNYTNFISGASSLNGINKANVSMQNSFTESTKNLMKQTGESFTNQLPQIKTYFDTQKKIAEINVDNANKGISNQAESDQSFYFNQFDGLNTEVVNSLNAFYQKDDEGNETGHLVDLKQKVTNYNTLIDGVRGNLSNQITMLTNKRNDLLGLENDLYSQFFSQNVSSTVDNFDSFSTLQTVNNAKTALAAKLQTPLGKIDNLTGSGYLTNLANLIGGMSVNVLNYNFDELVENGTIDEAMRITYEQELQVIGQYATAFGLSMGNLTLSPFPTADTVGKTLTRNEKMTVPAGTTYQSSALPSDVTVTPITATGISVNADNSITLENPTPTSGTGNPATFEFQIEVALGYQTSYSFDTTWKNQTTNTTLSTTTDTFALVPKENNTSYNQYIEDNFQELNALLSKIDMVASKITTLYASPTADYTSLLSATSTSDFQNSSQSSVFNMYGNMDLSTLSNRLSTQDVQDFLTIAQNNLHKVIQTIKDLNSSISALQKDESNLQNHLPENYFSDNLNALNDWYKRATSKIDEIYKDWKAQSATTLEVKDWSKYDSTKTELYTETSDSLIEQIQALVATTGKSTATVAESSTAVKDNSEQFEALVNQATTTQKDAQNLLANTDDLVSSGNQGVGESKGFYDDFSKTLANTRTKGVNTQGIYDFFVTPLQASNITPKPSKLPDTQKVFDMRWGVVFGIGLVIGVLGMIVGQVVLRRVRG